MGSFLMNFNDILINSNIFIEENMFYYELFKSRINRNLSTNSLTISSGKCNHFIIEKTVYIYLIFLSKSSTLMLIGIASEGFN